MRVPRSLLQFKWIAGTAIAMGCCFVLVFLIGVKEPRLSHHKQGSEECSSRQSFKVWFGKLLYYQVAAVYMLTRLTTNVSQVSEVVVYAGLTCSCVYLRKPSWFL